MENVAKRALSEYTANKRAFTFKSDCELRGINATCAQIVKLYNANDAETKATLMHDAIDIDTFVSKSFIDVAKAFTPNYFNSNGQICRLVKVYESNTETKEKFVAYSNDFEYINGEDGNGKYRYFKVPVYKYTTASLYNFVKRAYTAQRKAGKVAETLASVSTSALENELKKRSASVPESKPETTKKVTKK